MNRFDLVTLRLFVAVLDGGSLTAGAERFGISPAAASKRILDLEGHVGVTLLERGTRGVAATSAGLTLRQHAVDVVARIEQLAVAMDDLREGVHDHVRLWANSSACTGFLPDVLAVFMHKHPATRIDLEEALSEDAVRAVRSGAAELAVVGENTACDRLLSFRCQTDELVLLTPAHHPLSDQTNISFGKALAYEFVGLPRATSLMRQISAETERVGGSFRVRVQVRSFDAMCQMVAAGLGLCILPRTSVRAHVHSMGLHVLQLDGMDTVRELLVVMRSAEALTAPARALVDLMLDRDIATV